MVEREGCDGPVAADVAQPVPLLPTAVGSAARRSSATCGGRSPRSCSAVPRSSTAAWSPAIVAAGCTTCSWCRGCTSCSRRGSSASLLQLLGHRRQAARRRAARLGLSLRPRRRRQSPRRPGRARRRGLPGHAPARAADHGRPGDRALRARPLHRAARADLLGGNGPDVCGRLRHRAVLETHPGAAARQAGVALLRPRGRAGRRVRDGARSLLEVQRRRGGRVADRAALDSALRGADRPRRVAARALRRSAFRRARWPRSSVSAAGCSSFLPSARPAAPSCVRRPRSGRWSWSGAFCSRPASGPRRLRLASGVGGGGGLSRRGARSRRRGAAERFLDRGPRRRSGRRDTPALEPPGDTGGRGRSVRSHGCRLRTHPAGAEAARPGRDAPGRGDAHASAPRSRARPLRRPGGAPGRRALAFGGRG